MNADLKARWIAALRSGEYEQTDGQLRRRDAYCCLGVLCVVAGVPFIEDGYHFGEDEFGEAIIADDELHGELARAVGDQGQLIAMNDGSKDYGIRQHTFAEIADWIEQYIPVAEGRT